MGWNCAWRKALCRSRIILFMIGMVFPISIPNPDGTYTSETIDLGNLISANCGDGITVAIISGATSYSPRIVTNHIGTNAAGNGAGLGNGGHGIAIVNSSGAWIGGLDPHEPRTWPNVIAHNAGSG